jgi:hypothetical protein
MSGTKTINGSQPVCLVLPVHKIPRHPLCYVRFVTIGVLFSQNTYKSIVLFTRHAGTLLHQDFESSLLHNHSSFTVCLILPVHKILRRPIFYVRFVTLGVPFSQSTKHMLCMNFIASGIQIQPPSSYQTTGKID